MRQERAHFCPEASFGTTATPSTSGSVNAFAGTLPVLMTASLVIAISAQSAPFAAAASSLLPI